MIKIETKSAISRKGDGYGIGTGNKIPWTTYTINDAMDVLLSRLDEAIDDMESDRVQIVEEAWAEIDAI